MEWLYIDLSSLKKDELEELHKEVFGKTFEGKTKKNLVKKLRTQQLADKSSFQRSLLQEFNPFISAQSDMAQLYQAYLEEGGVGTEWGTIAHEASKEECLLQFSSENTKLAHMRVITLGLPSAYACPFAGACRTKAVETGGYTKQGQTYLQTGRLKAGEDIPLQFRSRTLQRQEGALFSCFAAANEVRRPNVAALRWRNFLCLQKYKTTNDYIRLIERSLAAETTKWTMFRFHEAGDFFNPKYLAAWMHVVRNHPHQLFYGYTTSLQYWVDRRKDIETIPNMHLIASPASKQCALIDKYKLRYAVLFYTLEQVVKAKLQIDVNEYIPAFGTEPFGLLLHNTNQPTRRMRQDARRNAVVIKQMAKLQDEVLKEAVIQRRLELSVRGMNPVKSDFRTKKKPWLVPTPWIK